jgi:hypothetical protein
MIIMELSSESKTGADIATDLSSGLVARSARSCAARKLARMLVAQGIDDQPVQARRNGVSCYTVKSLAAFAKTSVTEQPRLHVIPWAPHPHAVGELYI